MSISQQRSSASYRAVLDACVLVGFPIFDTLLRVAQRRIYSPCWTQQILEELERTLTGSLQLSVADARKRIRTMSAAFPAAMAPDPPDMHFGLPDPDDEHVLAAAIVSDAQAIVTFNIRDFPSEICSRHAVEILHPDSFLIQLLDEHTPEVRNAFYSQVGATLAPPLGFGYVLRRLTPQAPKFTERMTDVILRDLHDTPKS